MLFNLFLFWQEVTPFRCSAQVKWRWIFGSSLGLVAPTGISSLPLVGVEVQLSAELHLNWGCGGGRVEKMESQCVPPHSISLLPGRDRSSWALLTRGGKEEDSWLDHHDSPPFAIYLLGKCWKLIFLLGHADATPMPNGEITVLLLSLFDPTDTTLVGDSECYRWLSDESSAPWPVSQIL